jgi:hypothetical protein
MRIGVQPSFGKMRDPDFKITRGTRLGGIANVVEPMAQQV